MKEMNSSYLLDLKDHQMHIYKLAFFFPFILHLVDS